MNNTGTKIFLDSGNPQDTKLAVELLASLEGQTTNPSLIVKNPKVQECLLGDQPCSEEYLLDIYRDIVQEIRSLIGDGKSVSIEVYADEDTDAETMIKQGMLMNQWIPDAHVKLPITKAGLAAAHELVKQDINVNMTLCFSQEQALAVHKATIGARKGQVFISPFIGRLDDIGKQGIDLIKNILFQYESLESHVLVLAASIRSANHLTAVIDQNCDLVTVPLKVLQEWAADEFKQDYQINDTLEAIAYMDIDTGKKWDEYDISHPLTQKGLEKFAQDWKSIFNPHQ